MSRQPFVVKQEASFGDEWSIKKDKKVLYKQPRHTAYATVTFLNAGYAFALDDLGPAILAMRRLLRETKGKLTSDAKTVSVNADIIRELNVVMSEMSRFESAIHDHMREAS